MYPLTNVTMFYKLPSEKSLEGVGDGSYIQRFNSINAHFQVCWEEVTTVGCWPPV